MVRRVVLALSVAAPLGALAGGFCGWAMDAFPGLALTPEKFWQMDPENLWVWSILWGAVVGSLIALIAVIASGYQPSLPTESKQLKNAAAKTTKG